MLGVMASPSSPSATLVIRAFVGDAGDDTADYLQFYYVDNARAESETEGLLPSLLGKVDGLCQDGCTRKQAARIDLLFEWLEEARAEGWAEHQSGRASTEVPERYASGRGVTRVVVVTAWGGGEGEPPRADSGARQRL